MDAEARVRAARLDEAPVLRAIEAAAGRRYAEVGRPGDFPLLDAPVVEAAIAAGRAWVAVDARDAPIAFAIAWLPDDAVHLRELDVRPDHMGRGVGTRLVEHVCAYAEALERSQVTLTKFRDVPWNAPYYARRGFAVLDEPALPAWLRAIREEEDAAGLSRWPRVAMARATGVRRA